MAFRIGVGNSDFAAFRKQNAYYIDKTEIMYELLHETNNEITLFTRPRRFGKTLMMSMMENFFNIKKTAKLCLRDLQSQSIQAFATSG